MKLFKILAVFTLLFSSISPTTLVYAVSSLTPESSETANEETPTEPIAEPQVEEAPAVVDPVAEESSTEPTTPEPSTVEPQTEPAVPVPETAVPSPQIDLPNLPQYRGDLRRNGESSYQAAAQPGFNAGVSNLSELGPNVGDSISYSFTIPTHSLVYGNGTDWIAYIVGNGNIGVRFVDRMYYGRSPNHTDKYSTTYQIGRTEVVEVGGASGDLSITSNHTINNNDFTMTMSGTITRTRASNRTDYQLTAGIHNLVLGSTAVASGNEVDPTPIEDVPINYLSIGNFTVNTSTAPPAPTVEITANPDRPLILGEVQHQAQKDSLRVTVNGVLLPSSGPDSYEIIESNLGSVAVAGIVGSKRAWARIRYTINTTAYESERIYFNIPVVWGDSIAFGGSESIYSKTVAAFTLHHRGTRPLITATTGRNNSVLTNFVINENYLDQNYYNFSWYNLSQKNILDLTNDSADRAVSARGEDRNQDILNRWNAQTNYVNYGDVVRSWVADPEKNAVTRAMVENATFIFNGGEVYYEITTNGYRKLDINTLTPTEQSIERGASQASLDSQVSRFLDTSGKENLRVVRFLDYPDTSTLGEKTGTIQVEETLSTGKTVTYDYTVPFVVTPKFEVTAKPDSKVLLGTDMNTVDLRQFLDVEVDGEQLDDDKYEVEMTAAPIATDTVSVGRAQSIRVTVNGTTLSQDTSINIGVIWGDSVVFGGRDPMSSRTAAAFTLHHQGNLPFITASKGRRPLLGSNLAINSDYYGRDYYSFSWYDVSQKDSVNLTNDSAGQIVAAQGRELEDDVLNRWRTQTVNYGDVVRAWVADPTKNAVTENEQFVSNGGEVYYEITANGYRALNINKLTTSSHMILQGMTESELDSRLAEFLDVSSVENINLDRFVQYPDTSVIGTTSGTIRVTETLSTGKTVSYDYEITFTVENAPPTADPIAQELYLGESLPDSPMDLLENVSDDRDDPSELKATYLNRPNIDRVGEMTASIQLEDSGGAVSVIEVPITVKWGSTISLRGNSNITVGAYSLTKNGDGTLHLHSTFGDNSVYRDRQVHPDYGSSDFYHLEVFDGETSIYKYAVRGDQLIGEAINGFNHGNPLEVSVGNTIRVFCRDSDIDRNNLMVNEIEKNHTYETDYAYYRVTEEGLEPAPVLVAKSLKQDFVLGEDITELNPHDLFEYVGLNNCVISSDKYEVEQLIGFDTSLVGTRNAKVKITSTVANISLEVEIPYEVKWGSTISLRGLSDRTVGAYSLTRSADGTLRLHSTFGDNRTNQGMQVHSYYGSSVYYSIEVFDGETSTYQYEVTGNAIIRNAINGFNQGNPLEVSAGNIIKVFHGESHSRSRLMVNEVAENYSFGTPFSYYRVTDNGLVPIKHLEAEAVPQTFNLGESVDGRDLKEFVKDVQVNGVAVDASEYEISLRSEVNTTLIDTREVEVEIRTTDGLGILRTTVPYEVKWGSTISLRGLNDRTAGAYSLTRSVDGTLRLYSTFGDNRANLDTQVHPYYGSSVYYSIEVLDGETSTYQYEVPGNISNRNAINGFNQGDPLEVSAGNIIKVYHAESNTRSRLMVNEVAENYSFGTLFSYYRVTDNGLVPIKQLEAEAAPQTFNLGESADGRNLKELVRNVRVNGTVVDASEYEVTLRSELDTSLIGTREIEVEIRTTDELGMTQITVPYDVKWGSTISLRGLGDRTAGAYSLTRSVDGTLRLHSTFGDNRANLDTQVHPYYGSSVYYSIEVLDGETSTYQYEVTGNAVIRNAINGFNQGDPLEVSAGNIIKVYHAESNTRSRLMVNEVAENYSFGTLFSYYRVTDNGLVPIKQLEAEAVPQTFNLGESADERNLKELVRNVRVNGTVVDASEYEVTLRSELDTSLIGAREIDIEVRTTDGLGIVQLTVPYEVKWGNSIIAQDQAANSDKTVAVLSLTEENNLPKLTATQGDGLDSFSPVASAPQAVFYRGDLTSPRFSLLTNNLAMDAQTLRSNWNNVLRQNELAYGDVLSFEVFDSAGNNLLGNKTAVSRNEQLVKEVIGYPQAFYEMTANGFNLLRINQLKVETQTIESGLTEEELSQNIESYLSTDGFDTIHVTKFIQYPDTSKAGTSNGIIEVEETLATGGTATYNYTVPFIVENSTEWIDVKIPKKLLFGTTDANKGMVSSPLYYIENAGTRNLKVSVEEINITNNTNNLELLRTADADPSAERAAAKLRMNYKTSNILVDLYESTPNQIVAELAPNEQTQFMIEGQYFGNYQQEINIGLDIRYRFEVAS
ncbi:wall-associated protein [Enterococcus lactis]|uniref:wall-associated protein n=2 Tax=Enterococcus TaxID=1350 RepID=UPI0039826146